MSRIYLDHAATTPVDSEVLEKMIPYFSENFGNASSLYREGQISRESLDDARLSISKIIGCSLDEIIFTSGATESNNLAIKGVVEAWRKNPSTSSGTDTGKIPHIITSNIEHSSVKSVIEELLEEGKITHSFAEVNAEGIVSVEHIKELITENTALISVMAVNNEIGSVQPLSRIGRLCQKKNIPFHIDAVQAAGNILVSMEHWKADLISLSSHKFYGPKGVGLLAIRSGTEICAQTLGGGQERSYRGGTENVAGIVGMRYALEKSEKIREEEFSRLQKLQTIGKIFIEKNIPNAKWNGADIGDSRVPSNINFSVPEISGESLLMRLDLEGVSLSLGSACSAGMMAPSHVLLAIGCSEEEASTGIRISIGRGTTEKNLLEALEKIQNVVEDLREGAEFF
jgi:cysteine desulfurase